MPEPSEKSSNINVPTVGAMQSLLPQFEILAFIGAGGMGAVYKARQLKLNRLVAIKIFHQELEKKHRLEERFEREAQTMARLNHPNIVTLFEYGEVHLDSGHPMHYLVMEFVEGTDLKALLAEGTLDPQQTAAVLFQVCEAMRYAHDQKIIHRDIKPANIMIAAEGVVKVTDFGVAKLIDTPHQDPNLTQANMIVGTLAYIAPEQATNDTNVDRRADIYSLGVILYEMLTGALPKGAFSPPSEKSTSIDSRFDLIVRRSLQPDPDDRFQSISAFKDVLNEISQNPLGSFAGRNANLKTKNGAIRLPAFHLPALRIPIIRLALLLTTIAVIAFWVLHDRSEQTAIITSPPFVPASGDESIVRVFLMAGQMNMGGRANISHLQQLIDDPAKTKRYAHLQTKGQWSSRSDVWQHFHVLNREERQNHRNYEQDEIIGPLKVGFGKLSDVFGPDIQFGHVIGDALKERVLIIKYAPGRASLAVNYQPEKPPTPNSYKTLERKSERFQASDYGWAYQQMIHNFHDSLKRVPELLKDPKATRFELSGFIWLHGSTDAQNIKMAENYEQNLAVLIRSMRKDMGVSELPVIIGEFGPHGTEQVPLAVQLLRKAEKDLTLSDEFKDNTAFVETSAFMTPDTPHTGALPLYFRRADIIIEIGDALGQAALQFIDNPATDDTESVNQARKQFLENLKDKSSIPVPKSISPSPADK